METDTTDIDPTEMDAFVADQISRAPGLNGADKDDAFGQLSIIWKDIGFTCDEIRGRIQTADKHVSGLYTQMVDEEENVLSQMREDVNDNVKTIRELNTELGRAHFTYDGPSSLIERFNIVTAELNRIKSIRETVMVELHRLKGIEHKLCEQLDITSMDISLSRVPKEAELNRLKESIQMMENTSQERFAIFRRQKLAICSAYDILGEVPKDSWLRDILEADEDPYVVLKKAVNGRMENARKVIEVRRNERQIHKDNLEERLARLSRRLEKPSKHLKQYSKPDLSEQWILTLEAELRNLESEKMSKLKDLVEACREDIANLWQHMYFSQDQRDEFIRYYSEQYTEDLLEDHETELKRLEQNYSQHQNMYKGVDQWNELFEKYRVMDAEAKDPNRFKNNRGGILLKKQKEFKIVKKDLKRLETNLIADIEEWQKEHIKDFFVDGVIFTSYIETQWQAVSETKEIERHVRNEKKKMELAREMVYGSTPTKRGFGSTQNLADTKRSRIDITAQSKISRLPAIPPFRRPTTSHPKPDVPKEAKMTKNLRRRSKSASNLLSNPYKNIKSKISAGFTNFRTPQTSKTKSRLPVRLTKTDQKVKRKLELDDIEEPVLNPIIEDKENISETSLDFVTPDIPDYCPTSIKSAPIFDEGPLSYEQFGGALPRDRHVRSSAIGFTGHSHEI